MGLEREQIHAMLTDLAAVARKADEEAERYASRAVACAQEHDRQVGSSDLSLAYLDGFDAALEVLARMVET